MKTTSWVLAALALLCAVGIAIFASNTDEDDRLQLGLVTSLPIYWAESPSIESMLADGQEPHWVRGKLEQTYQLQPLDTLAQVSGDGTPSDALAKLDYLLLAQPAAMPPADLVALDSWVRGGGRALIFADPMLTEESLFGFGDKRRPQDIVTIDPLLARWGLRLAFDGDQRAGPRIVGLSDPYAAETLVDLPGAFILLDGPDAAADCTIRSEGLVADCSVGSGKVLLVADAAILQADLTLESDMPESALDSFLAQAFGS